MQSNPDYAGGRWTRARYRSFIVSALRRAWMRYPVKADAKAAARRDAVGRGGRIKYEYQCSMCKGWFLDKEVQVDHKECLPDILDDPAGYLGGMFCEEHDLCVLCKGC